MFACIKSQPAITFVLLAVCASLAQAEDVDSGPNIVVILADDFGYNDVGFTGETEIQTPLHRLH